MKTSLINLLLLCCFIFPAKFFSQSLSPSEFKEKLEKEHGVLIDVRSPAEFIAERLPGAINMDINDSLFVQKVKGLDKKQSYFLYCRIGKRSGRAYKLFKKEGFSKVYDLNTGITGWKAAGFPTVKGQ